MFSKDPLALFANQEAVQATKNLPLASIYPTMPIVDVEITNRYDMKNSTGREETATIGETSGQ